MGTGILRRVSTRRIFGPTLLAAALIAGGASCDYGPDASISHVELYNRAKGNGQVAWFCRSQGIGGAHGGHGDGLANDVYAGKSKGVLNDADCLAVAQFLDKARANAMKWPTRGAAKKAGFFQAVQFVPGLGTHDANPQLNSPGLDPERPMFLQYDGQGDEARIAGMSWLVYSPSGPPEGLPGTNDWWHTHASLCYNAQGLVIANEATDAQCTALGGVRNAKLPGIWMVHAWVLPGYENVRDVFSGAYMCLKGTGPLTDLKDPCRDDLTDPEHGHPTPPTTAPTSPTTAPTSPTTAPVMTTTTHGNHSH